MLQMQWKKIKQIIYKTNKSTLFFLLNYLSILANAHFLRTKSFKTITIFCMLKEKRSNNDDTK